MFSDPWHYGWGLQVVGELFYPQNYGVAIQRNITPGFDKAVSVEVLRLRESGVIDSLQRIWFTTVCVWEGGRG